ncbi:MAG: ATP-grasp domain-containing protein [Bradymonadia bacterium]
MMHSELSILFGRPWQGPTLDDRFHYEADAAEALGIESWAIPLDPVVNLAPERALWHLPPGCGRQWVYRGWMISGEEYEGLYEAILDRGDVLVTHPDEFVAATYMPEYLPCLGDRTAPSRWTYGEDLDEAWLLALSLGEGPWIIKDHVKSAKEHWHQACFVPRSVDEETFKTMCQALIDIRGDRFEGGIVIRKYLDLVRLPYASVSGPTHEEHRLVFWQGELVAHAPYFDGVEMSTLDPDDFAWIGDAIESPFFIADVARLASGGWTVIEINDGGCAILPDQMDPREMYQAMLDSI